MSVEHYDTLLAPIYDWMLGGWESCAQRHRTLFADLGVTPAGAGAVAVDVGAGTGHQSVPLAEGGYRVIAVEPSPAMRTRLRERVGALRIEISADPLSAHVLVEPELICCMGDTLAHFGSPDAVEEFVAIAGRALRPGGHLVVSYRDSTSLPIGDDRFIAVRSDRDRVLTCFLEVADADRIRVHDILHTRTGDQFEQRVSSYLKLRLRPSTVDGFIKQNGLEIATSGQIEGFVTTVATKP